MIIYQCISSNCFVTIIVITPFGLFYTTTAPWKWSNEYYYFYYILHFTTKYWRKFLNIHSNLKCWNQVCSVHLRYTFAINKYIIIKLFRVTAMYSNTLYAHCICFVYRTTTQVKTFVRNLDTMVVQLSQIRTTKHEKSTSLFLYNGRLCTGRVASWFGAFVSTLRVFSPLQHSVWSY